MIVQHRFNLITALRLLPLVACILVLVLAGLALALWVIDIGVFNGLIQSQRGQRGQYGQYGMTPNAAVCFILCGAALWLVRAPLEIDLDERGLDGDEWTLGASGIAATLSLRRFANISALAAVTLALLTFVGYVFGWNLGIERLLFWRQPPAPGGAFQNQMAPNTMLCFLFSGASLLLLDVELRRGRKPSQYASHYPSQYLALVTLLISLTALLGHVYGMPSVYDSAGMAAYTAFSFVALSAGLVCARPEQGLMAMVTSGSSGGFMARRMLIWAIIGPVLLGCLILLGVRAGIYDTAYGVPLLVAAIIVVSLIVVWRNAMRLHQIETERVLTEAALCQAYANTEKQVGEQASELIRANADMWAMMREREQAEDELRRNREELADFFENVPVGAHWIDPDGTILWANKAELDLLGYLPEEYIGHHVSKFYADKSVIKNVLNRLRRGENLDNHEVRLRAKDGSIRYGQVSSNGLWQDGQLVHTRGFVRDITERKQAEARLRESEERFRRMANAAPVMIWMSGPDKGGTFFNKGWLDFTGRPAEREVGIGWTEGVHKDDFARCLEIYSHAFDARREFTMEYRLRRYDGEYRWLLDLGVPRFAPDGVFLGYIGCAIDITGRKRAESELQRHRDELAHIARVSTLGELGASLAHELNQPLTAILSNAQAAQRFLASNPADLDEVGEILKDIVKDDHRASEVIQRLRALVKKEVLAFALIELPSVINEVVQLLHSDAILHSVQVDVESDPGLPLVRGDPVQLQQVMLNLLLNAMDSMKNCPVDERRVIVGAQRYDRGFLRVAVRDQGVGLTADRLEKIFQPFYSTKRDGLGMGLAISRSIVEAHGGLLWAESNLDRGATFYFTVAIEKSNGGISVEGRGTSDLKPDI